METYMITITFFSSGKKFVGDEKVYFFHYKKGNKVAYGDSKGGKRYLSEKRAKNMARTLQEIYPETLIMVL